MKQRDADARSGATAGWLTLRLALLSLVALPFLIWPVLLLMVAQTGAARLTALAVIVVMVGLWIVLPGLRRELGYGRILLVTVVVALLLLLGALALSPAGVGGASTGLSAQGVVVPRWGLTNLVPEVDQLLFGSYPIQLLDPRLDGEKAATLRHDIQEIYGEARRDPQFREARSALGQAYGEIAGLPADRHAFVYVPAEAEQPLPVLLFLHGAMGNFQGYTWVWKEAADAHGWAIYAPSFGAGQWQRKTGRERLAEAIEACRRDPRLDADRMVLACLSQGGWGGWWAATAFRDHFRGYVFLSPVLTSSMATDMAVAQASVSQPVLVLHGEEDARIPAGTIRQAVETLERGGVPVQATFFPGETHFLFFARRHDVLAEVAAWIKAEGVLEDGGVRLRPSGKGAGG